jgi:hypothetical protein
MGEKWPGIIGWFVTIKCWSIVVFSKDWVSWNCSHEEEEMMTIIGSFLDGISWRSCREKSSTKYDVVAVILTLSMRIATHLRWAGGREGMRYTEIRNDQLISNESEEKEIAIWRDGLWFQLGRNFINLCKPFWMNVERRKFFWITLFGNVSQLKWFILKEPFEDRKYLGTHFKYKIKITLG